MRVFVLSLLALVLLGCETVDQPEQVTDELIESENLELAAEEFSGFENRQAGVRIDFMENFEVRNLPENAGFVMTRRDKFDWYSKEKGASVNPYTIEIGFRAEENIGEFADVAEYLTKEFPGYTYEFAGQDAFVNENIGDEVIRYFLHFSDNGKWLFVGSMKVPSKIYDRHAQWFDQWVQSAEYF